MGGAVQPRLGPTASDSTSCLTATPVPEPPNGQPNVPANSRQPAPRGSLAASSPHHPPCPKSADGHKVSLRRLKTDTGPLYPKSCPNHRLPLPLIAHSAAVTSSLRWIRAKGWGTWITAKAGMTEGMPTLLRLPGESRGPCPLHASAVSVVGRSGELTRCPWELGGGVVSGFRRNDGRGGGMTEGVAVVCRLELAGCS